MAYDAKAIANVFYKLARSEGKYLTNMQLQKLVYIAHGFNLAVLGEPLFSDSVHAWEYGPVIPSLYEELKSYGAEEVKRRLLTKTPPVKPDDPEMKVIRAVWNSYGRYSGLQLSAITHVEGTPWSEIWKTKPFGVIPNELIAQHYRELLDERYREAKPALA
jgi:uncharacterized phage-associated protein